MKENMSFSLKRLSAMFAVAMLLGESAQAQSVLTALHGTDGANSKESYAALTDGMSSTKWCVKNFTQAYVVMKADEAFVPTEYYLTTANDTGGNPTRNWSSWQVWAGNFDSDADATEDAEGWVMIEEKTDVPVEEFPDANFAVVSFEFSNTITTAYKYYKVVVTGIRYGGETGSGTMQMADFAFVNPVSTTYTALSGVDGFSVKEGYASLVDGTGATKWCSNKGNWYVVFKSNTAIAPAFYSLFTANDTKNNAARNWKSWRVYGANFESDEQATREADAWTLMDERKDVGNDRLPAANLTEAYFGLGAQPSEKYQYFKIELDAIMSGTTQQMGDFAFGTKDRIARMRNNFYQAVAAYNLEVVAMKSLLDEYAHKLEAMKTSADVEELVLLNLQLTELQSKINASVNAYATYQSTVDDVKAYLLAHPEMSSTGRKILQAYVDNNAAPSDTYPNGTYPYIMEQLTLSEEQLTQEVVYLYDLLQQYADGSNDGIEATYMAIEGTAGTKTTEDFGMLIDGERTTKWCMKPFKGDCYVIFQASQAIKPSYYCLTTGNDTGGNPGRNWKSWKIYGANFANQADVARESDAWTLLDEKTNVGTDQLPAANATDAYLYMSGKATVPYEYFKIEITQIMSGEIMQMAEITFGNQSNFMAYRNKYYEECAGFDTTAVCRHKLIEEYNELLAQLKATTNINTLKSIYSSLLSKQTEITTSATNYANYIAEVENAQDYLNQNPDLNNPSTQFLKKYLTEEVAPGDIYPNGSYPYILKTVNLSDYDITHETTYVTNLLNAAINGGNVALRGTAGYGANETFSSLVDGTVNTKWAGNFSGTAYVVFKTPEATAPYFYTLVTANDAVAYPDRNWKTWSIYGANFASDEEATQESDAWTLLDAKTDMTFDRVYKKDHANCYFGFSEENNTNYQYYKVEVTAVQGGSAQQMSELIFGTQEDFLQIRDSIFNSLSDFNQDVAAQNALLSSYSGVLTKITGIEEMEELMEVNLQALALQDSIAQSVEAYGRLEDKVGETMVYLEEHDGELTGECLKKLVAYLEDYIEPNETYPNGSYEYIKDEMELSADQINVECESIDKMLEEAILNTDQANKAIEITMMLTNPAFENGYDGWEGKQGTATDNNGKVYVGESYGSTFDISQTITGLKNGLYEFRMQAAYRPGDDVYCNNYAAQIYANGIVNYVQAELEDGMPEDQAEDHVNCYLSEDNSAIDLDFFSNEGVLCYVPNRAHGATYAFGAGRYDNRVMVNVTDGTLTIGIKDMGTGAGNDWTSFTNARLYYCGEVSGDGAAASLDATLEAMAARAITLAEGDADEGYYWLYPNFSTELREKLAAAAESVANVATNEQKYALVEQFSALFQEVYTCKQGYCNMASTVDHLLEVASTDYPEEQFNEFYTLYEEIWDSYCRGAYSTEDVQNLTMFNGNAIYTSVYGEKPIQKEGIYQLANALNLRWFSASVNNGSSSLNAVLTQDIDMKELTDWSAIGTSDKPYAGNFDGQGHTITGFYKETTSDRRGFFGHVKQADIRNFGIEGVLICSSDGAGAIGYADASTISNVHSALNIDATGSKAAHIGGVAGQALNGTKVEYCSYSGTMTIGGSYYDCFAGIVGYTNNATIEHCANYGSITFGRIDCYAGGILGYVNNSSTSVNNCLSVGSVQYTGSNPSYSGAIVGWLRGYDEAKFAESYWLNSSAKRASGGNTLGAFHSATTDEMASGAVCYALNEAAGKTVWYQTLGEDAYPVLDATHKQVVKTADGYANVSGNETLGDLNGDGTIDGTDIVALVRVVIGENSDESVRAIADLNGDNVVDGSDIARLVIIVMNMDEAEAKAYIRKYYPNYRF